MFWSKLFRYSRWVHRYIGLLGILILAYFILMGVSGILLNHRGLISGYSLPVKLMPPSYRYRNWNRMALRDVVFSTRNENLVYAGGREGVWVSADGGRQFRKLERGFPVSAYLQDSGCLLLVEEGSETRLFAGTRSGLYYCDPNAADPQWESVAEKGLRGEQVVSLLQVKNRIFAFTSSCCYAAKVTAASPQFSRHELAPPAVCESRISCFLFLLTLHDGSLFGLPGRLLVDGVGLALIFLCASALYIWFVPWRKRQFPGRRKKARFYQFFYRYHLKIGIIGAFFITVIALTGMLIWKPIQPHIIRHTLPAFCYPAERSANPWQGRIDKAAYLAEEGQLLLATRDGFFVGPVENRGNFTPLASRLPVRHATVLKPLAKRQLLVASFTNGLYLWERACDRVSKLHRSRGRTMVTAAAVRAGEPLFWTSYEHGLTPLAKMADLPFTMPPALAEAGRISLWSFLLGLHNGHLFQDLLPAHWWIVQIGGLLLLLTTLSGTYDWFYRKGFFKKASKAGR
ncbi:MAG: PepSY domain-containing protein [Deltaproteobacteria bacterium]|nr:PepSY domain-containing protein [Deltaproteobacteria bacterium]